MNIFGKNYNLKRLVKDNSDLCFVPVFVVLSILFILISPFNETFLRIIITLPLLLFMPGYMFIAAMFPKRGELTAIERFTLSIGLSIAITVFDGFGLNYTRWGFRPNSITISLSIIIILLLLITLIQRWRYGKESYSFSIGDIRSFFDILNIKETQTGPEYDPALEKMLIKTMIIAILIVTSMLILAKVTQEPEKFTALYILGSSGKAENYISQVSVGEPSTILVGVENYEHAPVNYTLLIDLGGATLAKEEIHLDHEEKWINNVTFIPQLTDSIAFAGANKSKLEFQLLKNNYSYRSVHLLVNTSLDNVEFTDFPEIINGDMESNEGWAFSGSPGIKGGYNIPKNFSSRVYKIDFTSKGQGSYGRISQNFTINGSARAVLSFDIKDSLSNISNFTFKQALLDDKVIWESNSGIKNNSWEHVEVPVLLSLNGTFSLGIFGRNMSDDNVTVWIDNVYLIPYIPKIKEDSKIRSARKLYDFKLNIMGEPRQLKKNMRIDGFNFPGFEYDINENRSYEELTLNITGLNEKLPVIDTGNATYITRVNGTQIKLMGSHFNILGKDLPDNLSRIIEIPSTGVIKPGETFKLGGDFSLSVSLISSSKDSAMISLQKSGSLLESKLVKKGIYEYRKNVGKFQVVIFRTKVESINSDSVDFIDMELYSDEITELKLNEPYGDFELVNISSDEVVFKNSYPIELKDKTAILKGSAGFRISGDTLYPYTSNVKLRGTPQYINAGNWMNITGFNYPGFSFENNASYEELRVYFIGAGYVKEGDATYVSKVHNGKISFLGNSYELIQPSRPGYISNIIQESQINLVGAETKGFGGYNFNFKKINDDHIQLWIRSLRTKDQQDLLKKVIEFNKSIFSDVNYFMLTGSKTNMKKSNILETGELFEYWEEFKPDRDYKKIAGRIESINNSFGKTRVNLTATLYEVPFEILPGKTYGDFEVYSISNNSIILKNTKPLLFERGKEIPLLGGIMQIKTSAYDFLAYPEK